MNESHQQNGCLLIKKIIKKQIGNEYMQMFKQEPIKKKRKKKR